MNQLNTYLTICSLFFFITFIPFTTTAVNAQVYYGGDEEIKSISSDLSATSTFLAEEIGGLAIDTTNQVLFYSSGIFGFTPAVNKISLDGTGEVTIISSGSLDRDFGVNDATPMGIAVDVDSQHVYVADILTSQGDNAGRILRVDYDGENGVVIIEGAPDGITDGIKDLAIDTRNGRLYWGTYGAVKSSDLNGSDTTTVVTIPFYTVTDQEVRPNAVEIDTANNKIYWTDQLREEINRADLDGSNQETVVETLNRPASLYIDHSNAKLYWIEGGFSSGDLWRSDLDGGNAEELYAVTRPDEGLVVQNVSLATGNETGEDRIPGGFSLSANYPNPFNPSTQIGFTLTKSAQVSLQVFNALGQQVSRLIDQENRAPGTYSVTFRADELPSGVYYYKLTTGGESITRAMTLIK